MYVAHTSPAREKKEEKKELQIFRALLWLVESSHLIFFNSFLLQAVLLRAHDVVAWHKAPTTADMQTGVAQSIHEVIRKSGLPPASISSVHIGTTVRCSVTFCSGSHVR